MSHEITWEDYAKLTDKEIAAATGRTVSQVRNERHVRGIKKWVSRPWEKYEDQMLGEKPDAQVAVILKREPQEVRKRRIELKIKTYKSPPGTPRRNARTFDRSLLGTMPDAVLARKLGISRQRIHALRKESTQ